MNRYAFLLVACLFLLSFAAANDEASAIEEFGPAAHGSVNSWSSISPYTYFSEGEWGYGFLFMFFWIIIPLGILILLVLIIQRIIIIRSK